MTKKIVITAEGYDSIDGRNAHRSKIKRLTLGAPMREENQSMKVAAQIWREGDDGRLQMDTELPLHQVLDLMILLSRTLLHFREAYRLPLLYDPQNPTVERIGIQGGAMPVSVCAENPSIREDILAFSDALNELGEITGERLRVLARIFKEMEYD